MSKYVRKFWFEGQLALAFGVLLLLAAVALADPTPTVWPADGQITSVEQDKICKRIDCILISGCDKRENHPTLTALPAVWKYVKINKERRVGQCKGYPEPGANGSNCTIYEFRACAELYSYQTRDENDQCTGESTITFYFKFNVCEP
jgi:hypothetical protein